LLLVHLLRPADSRNPRAVPLLGLPTDGRSDDRRVAGPVGLNTAPGSAPRALTHRETEILGWVSAGLQNKEIAQELGISLFTIRNHVHNILEKLEVHSKLEAISLAFRRGWITPLSAPPPRTKVPERANRES
jgi:DNA-binding CsgD family transcriptional regulator